MENKTIFKVGDKVFDYHYKWVRIIELKKEGAAVRHVNEMLYLPYDTLSFTEYDFVNGGFSQERPQEVPKIGDVVWVRDRNDLEWTIMHFIEKQDNCYVVTEDNPFDAEETAVCYKYLTTLNPYKK